MSGYCDLILDNLLSGVGVVLSGGNAQPGDRVLSNLIDPDPDLAASISGVVVATLPAPAFVGGVAVLLADRSLVGVDIGIGSQAPVTVQPGGDHAIMRVLNPQVRVSSVNVSASGLARYLIAGPRFRGAVNIRHGSSLNLPPRTDPQISPAGTAWLDYPTPRRVADVEWLDLSRSEARTLMSGVANAQALRSLVAISLYSGSGGARERQASFVGYVEELSGPASVIASSSRAGMRVVEVAG